MITDILTNSGSIAGRHVVSLNALKIHNLNGASISGNNVTLDANRDLILKSSQDTAKDTAKNTYKSGEIGLTMGGEAGIGVCVSASGAKGNGQGESTTYRETQISAANTLQTNSGRDTTLEGAQLRGDTVTANVGRDLSITSQQDTDTYKRKDTNAGVDAAFGTGGGSVSGSANQTRINSDYKSVNEQSGIEAGEGGYTVTVGNHTQLNGGAIASSAEPSKNSLSTQTLGATTLDNQASYIPAASDSVQVVEPAAVVSLLRWVCRKTRSNRTPRSRRSAQARWTSVVEVPLHWQTSTATKLRCR